MKKYTLNSTAFYLRLLAIVVCLSVFPGCALLSVFDGEDNEEKETEMLR